MKGKFAIIVLIMFLLSTLSIAAQVGVEEGVGIATQEEPEEETPDDTTVGIPVDHPPGEGPRLRQVVPAEKAVSTCQDYLEKNAPDIENPDVACKKILVSVKACIDYLQEKNVRPVRARQICGRLVSYSRVQPILIGKTAENVASYRLRRLQSVTAANADAAGAVEDLPEADAEVFTHLGRGQQQALLKMNHTDRTNRLKDFKLVKVETANMFKRRVVSRPILKQVEHKFEMADSDYRGFKNNSSKEWAEFQSAKREGNAEKAFTHAKRYLLHTTNLLIKAMERVKHKVEISERFTEEDADNIISEIDSVIAQLEDVKTEIEAATTKEEIKSAASTLREIWKVEKIRYKRFVLRLEYARTGEIIERSAHLENRFDCAMSALEEQGIDSSSIELLTEDFSTQIEQARENHRLAKDYLVKAKELREEGNVEDAHDSLEHGRNLLKDAQKDLKEAHGILKRIVREIKESGGDVSACKEKDADVGEDEEVVVVDEAEEMEEEETEVEEPENWTGTE